MMKTYLALSTLLFPIMAYANDGTGFVATGGVQYLKNPHIAMQTEDLYISRQQIRVHYQFKNLSQQDITETVLFPLPRVDDYREEVNFANTQQLINSFKIWVNGKAVKPKVHLRAFLYPVSKEGDQIDKPVDVTEALQRCGVSDTDFMNIWQQKDNMDSVRQKIVQCKAPKLRQVNPRLSLTNLFWATQIVYSWQQTFKAGEITEVKHQYTPLVGFTSFFDINKNSEDDRTYCVDDGFRTKMQRSPQKDTLNYFALGYILTTGANWAKPIGKFTLTIDRKPDEFLFLCWDESLRKIGPNRFQAVKYNFLPKRDLDIAFVQMW